MWPLALCLLPSVDGSAHPHAHHAHVAHHPHSAGAAGHHHVVHHAAGVANGHASPRRLSPPGSLLGKKQKQKQETCYTCCTQNQRQAMDGFCDYPTCHGPCDKYFKNFFMDAVMGDCTGPCEAGTPCKCVQAEIAEDNGADAEAQKAAEARGQELADQLSGKVEAMEQSKAQFSRDSRAELAAWQRNDAPKLWNQLDDVKALQDRLLETADDTIKEADGVKAAGFAESEDISNKLTSMNDAYVGIMKQAEARHEQASLNIQNAAAMVEMDQGTKATDEWTLVTNDAEDQMTQIELAEERLAKKKEQILDRLAQNLENLRTMSSDLRTDMLDDWDKLNEHVTSLQADESQHDGDARDLIEERKKLEGALADLDKDAARLVQKQANDAGNAGFSEVNAVSKESKAELVDASKGAHNELKQFSKGTRTTINEIKKEISNAEREMVNAALDQGFEAAQQDAAVEKQTKATSSHENKLDVIVEGETDKATDVGQKASKDLSNAVKYAQDSTDHELETIEQNGQNQGRIEQSVMDETVEELKRQGLTGQSDLTQAHTGLKTEFNKEATAGIRTASDASAELHETAKSVKAHMAERVEQDREVASLIKILQNRLSTMELAFSKEVRSRSNAQNSILKEVDSELPEDLESLSSEFGDIKRITTRAGEAALRQTAGDSQALDKKVESESRQEQTRMHDNMPFAAASEQAANKAATDLPMQIDRVHQQLLPSLQRMEKAGTSVQTEMQGTAATLAKMMKELSLVLVEGKGGVLQYAMQYGNEAARKAARAMHDDMIATHTLEKHVNSVLGANEAGLTASSQQVTTANQHAQATIQGLTDDVSATSANARNIAAGLMSDARQSGNDVEQRGRVLAEDLQQQVDAAAKFPDKFNSAVAQFAVQAKHMLADAKKKFVAAQQGSTSENTFQDGDNVVDNVKAESMQMMAILAQLAVRLKSSGHEANSAEHRAEQAIKSQLQSLGIEADYDSSGMDSMLEAIRAGTGTFNSATRASELNVNQAFSQHLGQASESVSGKTTSLQNRAAEYMKNYLSKEHRFENTMTSDVNHMEEAGLAVGKDIKSYGAAAKDDAVYLDGVAGKTVNDQQKNEDMETKSLQGTGAGLNNGMERELTTAERMAAMLANLQKATQDTTAADQDSWKQYVLDAAKMVKDGYATTAHDASIATAESQAVAKSGQSAEITTEEALQEAIRMLASDGGSLNSRMDQYAHVIDAQKADGRQAIATEQDKFQHGMNSRLGGFSKYVELFIQHANTAKAAEEASMAKQAQFAKKLEAGENLEAVHDQAEVDQVNSEASMMSYSVGELDTWLDRFRQHDKNFNLALFNKLSELNTTVDSDIYKQNVMVGVEKTELQAKERSMVNMFQHAMQKQTAAEKAKLAELDLANSRMIEKLNRNTRLDARTKARMIAAIEASSAALQKRIMNQQGDLEGVNSAIKDHMDHFDNLVSVASRMAGGLTGESAEAMNVEQMLDHIESSVGNLKHLPLYKPGAATSYKPRSSLAEVRADGAAERNLRSLQQEDAQLARANTELAAELEAAEKRLS